MRSMKALGLQLSVSVNNDGGVKWAVVGRPRMSGLSLVYIFIALSWYAVAEFLYMYRSISSS